MDIGLGGMDEDLSKCGIKQWLIFARDREAWRNILRLVQSRNAENGDED